MDGQFPLPFSYKKIKGVILASEDGKSCEILCRYIKPIQDGSWNLKGLQCNGLFNFLRYLYFS